MPGRLMSYVYRARPDTLSGPSRRLIGVESSVGLSGQEYLATHHPHHRLGFHRRFHHSDERAAAADVAVELALRLFDGGVRIFLHEGDRRDDEAGSAEAAHQRVDVAESLLHRMQRAAGR